MKLHTTLTLIALTTGIALLTTPFAKAKDVSTTYSYSREEAMKMVKQNKLSDHHKDTSEYSIIDMKIGFQCDIETRNNKSWVVNKKECSKSLYFIEKPMIAEGGFPLERKKIAEFKKKYGVPTYTLNPKYKKPCHTALSVYSGNVNTKCETGSFR